MKTKENGNRTADLRVWTASKPLEELGGDLRKRLEVVSGKLLAALEMEHHGDDDDDDDDLAPDDDDDDDDASSLPGMRLPLVSQAAAWFIRSPEESITLTLEGGFSETRENPGRLWTELSKLGANAKRLGLSERDLVDMTLVCSIAWRSQLGADKTMRRSQKRMSSKSRAGLAKALADGGGTVGAASAVLAIRATTELGALPFGTGAAILAEHLEGLHAGDDDDDDDDVVPDDDDDDDDVSTLAGIDDWAVVNPILALADSRRVRLEEVARRVHASTKQNLLGKVTKWFSSERKKPLSPHGAWGQTRDNPERLWRELATETSISELSEEDLKDLTLVCSIVWRYQSGAERKMHTFMDQWPVESRVSLATALQDKRSLREMFELLDGYAVEGVGCPPFGATASVLAVVLDERLN